MEEGVPRISAKEGLAGGGSGGRSSAMMAGKRENTVAAGFLWKQSLEVLQTYFLFSMKLSYNDSS